MKLNDETLWIHGPNNEKCVFMTKIEILIFWWRNLIIYRTILIYADAKTQINSPIPKFGKLSICFFMTKISINWLRMTIGLSTELRCDNWLWWHEDMKINNYFDSNVLKHNLFIALEFCNVSKLGIGVFKCVSPLMRKHWIQNVND